MLRIEEITDPGKLTSYRTAWENMLTRSSTADLFQTYEWLMTWLEAFWGRKPIQFLLAWQDDVPMALAPFLRDDLGELACSPGFVLPVNQVARRANILYAGQPAQAIEAMLHHLNQRIAVRLILQHLEQNSATVQLLPEAAHGHGMTTLTRTEAGSPIVSIQEDWNSYLNSRSTHLRSELRRKRRQLEAAGRIEFVTSTEQSGWELTMEAVLRTERNSWKAAAGSSLTSEAATGYFYDTLARRCAKRGWLRIYLLLLDGVPIAYIYGVVFGKVYYALKTSHDATFASYSPGTVLFEHTLRDAFDQKLEAFEFLGYESQWKNEMANDVKAHVNLCVFSRGLVRCEWCRLCEHRFKPFARKHVPFASTVKRKLHDLHGPDLRSERSGSTPEFSDPSHLAN